MEEQIQEYLEINAKIKELKNRKEELKSVMSVMLVEKDLDTYEDDKGNLVSYKNVKRNALDKKKVEEFVNNEQVYKTLFTESEVKVFKIRAAEGDEE